MSSLLRPCIILVRHHKNLPASIRDVDNHGGESILVLDGRAWHTRRMIRQQRVHCSSHTRAKQLDRVNRISIFTRHYASMPELEHLSGSELLLAAHAPKA